MTSLAFIVGMIPMMTAVGPSAQGNHSISIAAAGGMLTGVVLGLFIIPILFIVFQFIQEKIGSAPKQKQSENNAVSLEMPVHTNN